MLTTWLTYRYHLLILHIWVMWSAELDNNDFVKFFYLIPMFLDRRIRKVKVALQYHAFCNTMYFDQLVLCLRKNEHCCDDVKPLLSGHIFRNLISFYEKWSWGFDLNVRMVRYFGSTKVYVYCIRSKKFEPISHID